MNDSVEIATKLRALAADTMAWNGHVMQTWDRIREQVESLKGSDIPRMNFESLMEDFAEHFIEAAAEIERLRAALIAYVHANQTCTSISSQTEEQAVELCGGMGSLHEYRILNHEQSVGKETSC